MQHLHALFDALDHALSHNQPIHGDGVPRHLIFAIAYDEGRLIGILTGTGGIADEIAGLIPLCNKETGAIVFYDDDPMRLIDKLVNHYQAEHANILAASE